MRKNFVKDRLLDVCVTFSKMSMEFLRGCKVSCLSERKNVNLTVKNVKNMMDNVKIKFG